MKTKILLFTVIAFSAATGFAQETSSPDPFKPSKTQFMIRGYGHAGLEFIKEGEDAQSTYVGSSFAPIFLFKHGDKLLFEAELEFTFDGNEFDIAFEYANMSYLLNDYMTIRLGQFLLPFGTFGEKLHPSWINKFPNMPLGFGHGGIAPSSGTGIEIRGAIPLGSAKLTYSVYSTNGPRLHTGYDADGFPDEPDEAGQLKFDNFVDNNNNKATGGRLALLPLTNSSLEIGASVYAGAVGDQNDPLYSNVGALLYAFDFSYVKQVSAIGGIIDIKGQYNQSNVDDATYFEPEPDNTVTPYTFDNKSNSYYAQLSYRPSMAGSDVMKNFEFAGRYSSFTAPEGSEWEQESSRFDVSLNYWMNWRTVFKLSYQRGTTVGGHDAAPGEETQTDGLFVHWALGF
jgi:hypothetical protein